MDADILLVQQKRLCKQPAFNKVRGAEHPPEMLTELVEQEKKPSPARCFMVIGLRQSCECGYAACNGGARE